MAEKQLRAGIYVATKTYLVEHNLWVRMGDTVVAGHPLLKGHLNDGTFKPWAPTFGVQEPAPVAAPEPETGSAE